MTDFPPGKTVASFALPLPIDALPIIGDLIERIYGTGETMMRPSGHSFDIVTPRDGFGPLARARGKLPGSAADAMKTRALDIREGRLKLTVEDAQYQVLVIAETMRKWFDSVGGTNYVELQLQMPGEDGEPENIEFTFTLQRTAGKTPHALREEAERRVVELETEVEELKAELAEDAELKDEYLLQDGDNLPAGPVRKTIEEVSEDRDYVEARWGSRKIVHRKVTAWQVVGELASGPAAKVEQ